MTNEETVEVVEGVSNGTPIPAKVRVYRTPYDDHLQTVFEVAVDRNGDVLIDQHALDTLLRTAGFWEIKK